MRFWLADTDDRRGAATMRNTTCTCPARSLACSRSRSGEIDVMDERKRLDFWSRSDAMRWSMNIGGNEGPRAGLVRRVIERWVHLLGVSVRSNGLLRSSETGAG